MDEQEEPGYAYINKPKYDLNKLREKFKPTPIEPMHSTIFYIHGANATPDSFSYLISGMPAGLTFDYCLYDARVDSLHDIIHSVKYEVAKNEQPVHIVGHSLGGVIGVNIAHEMPDAVASVTTLATPFKGIELPLFLRLLHWHNPFMQNVIPTNLYYGRAQRQTTVPLHVIKTLGGHNPLYGYPNDGVVSLDSQNHNFADQVSEVPWNHFEVLLHPSIRNAIVEFIGDVDGVEYK